MAKRRGDDEKTKSRPFSIYLLKKEYDATNSLVEGHDLNPELGTELPESARLFILDSKPSPPWWKKYFGIEKHLEQQHKGAIVFIPIKQRCFALSFGQVFHRLDDNAFEYDFGLRVTLNSLDPDELKSADMVAPGAAKRKRTQVPISADLTYLDFDGNSEIIKCLTGKVKKEHKALFKNATGSDSLKVSLKLKPDELPGVCHALLDLYDSKAYETIFPNIRNIMPVRDPTIVSKLNDMLLESLRVQDGDATLTIPDIVDYRDNVCCIFRIGKKKSEIYPDMSLEYFYNFLGDEFNFDEITFDFLKNCRMILTDADGKPSQSYTLYRSLFFDVETNDFNLESDDTKVIYHLCEGQWYKAKKSYVNKLNVYLDAKCEESDLCPYNHDRIEDGEKAVYSESNYNSAIPIWNKRFICLDQENISPSGQTNVEPCDIYTVQADSEASAGYRGWLYHIKISTRSSHLSHLFNQGVNSVDLIMSESTSREKMKKLVKDRLNGNDEMDYLAPFSKFDFKIIFGIITHKEARKRSRNLPLFSRISLMRNLQTLDRYRIPSALTFISDESPKKTGYKDHEEVIVEVCLRDGQKEIRALFGEHIDLDKPIKGCPKELFESDVGTRYKLQVKRSTNGDLKTYYRWPYEILVQDTAKSSVTDALID